MRGLCFARSLAIHGTGRKDNVAARRDEDETTREAANNSTSPYRAVTPMESLSCVTRNSSSRAVGEKKKRIAVMAGRKLDEKLATTDASLHRRWNKPSSACAHRAVISGRAGTGKRTPPPSCHWSAGRCGCKLVETIVTSQNRIKLTLTEIVGHEVRVAR
jgi:hypothetical protein